MERDTGHRRLPREPRERVVAYNTRVVPSADVTRTFAPEASTVSQNSSRVYGMTQVASLSLPPDLIAEVDEARGMLPRAYWMELAVRAYLDAYRALRGGP